jgi:photosystem II stability/assembly factor-like uncharacterized protein
MEGNTPLGGIALIVLGTLLGPAASAQRRPAPRKAPTTMPAQPAAVPGASAQAGIRYKGIWEPISYPDDVHFFDVFFATADEGWVAGGANETAGGLILHTTDAGDHWEVQYGDPESSERAINELRFLDQTHGWAVQRTGSASRLLHTRDGKQWIVAGTIDENHNDYMFTSEKTGVSLSKDVIKVTADGGRTWKPVFPCAAKIQVNGLWQNVACEWRRLQFLTPSVAYAVAKSYDAPTELFLAETADGGATWSMVTQELTGYPEDAFFVDANTGYVRVGSPDTGQVYKTTDGGQTWTGMAASPGRRMQFADPEVGWALLYRKVSFTTDGGNRWNSREYAFPAPGSAFSLPRRDRGYVVGEHGMIYRYRIVPVEYTAKGMIPAPLLSGMDPLLEKEVQQLASQVQQLAKDTGIPPMDFTQDTTGAGGASGFSGSAAPAFGSPADTTGGAFSQSTSSGFGGAPSYNASGATAGGAFPGAVAGCPNMSPAGSSASFGASAQPSTNYGVADATPATTAPGGFSQDTSTPATASTAAPPSGVSTGFVQDTATATTAFNSVSTTVPQFVSKYRNLNLMLAGFQMAAQMPASVQCLRQSFQALRNIKDPQSATAAVANIQGQVGGLVRLVRMAFQRH